tara:strand:+ start:2035 stop:3045 length:1011 start_codon:yes stop_codon:yes gene_type:complete
MIVSNRKSSIFSIKKYAKFAEILEIEEIEIKEYCQIYHKYSFSNNSHIQSPGYYLKSENIIYLKIKKGKDIVAILSLLNRKFFLNIFKVARLNSGPLIIKEFYEYRYYILLAILRFIKNKYTKLISFAPSSLYKDNKFIGSYNCFKLKYLPYKTYVLDLLDTEEYIFKNLRSNWRNSLRKSLKLTNVKKINNIISIKMILTEYKNYANELGFNPVSLEKCLSWSDNLINNKNFLNLKIYQAYNASNANESLGSIGILCFKDSALYLFGYTTKLGKKYQANYALLWKGIIDQKNNGINTFDLGGINEQKQVGIMKFKKGLGGDLEENLGEYFYFGYF